MISRSQARQLMERVEGCGAVVLDFADVAWIGQAFADEVFRVFANAHPDVELVPLHAVPAVQQMIRRAEMARDEGRA
ncbi:MAG: STAS-like domain-containing protein [Rhodanobacteraceae bacterium]